ncbi:MAG TPA: tetratricopeptide repeat protein [Longimicrobiales bacterium]|nr:tetratricopeptide repeat protein [Longimicrobiales bacterium]
MRSGWIGAALVAAMVGAGLGGSGGGASARLPVARAAFAPALLPGIGDVERGNRHFREGRFGEAVEAYQAALADGRDGPVLRYNLGTALLKLGRYAEAEEHLRGALDVVEPETREWVYYNLGQRFLEDARGQGDPRATAGLYDAAVEAYRQALRLQPGDVDAKWNYELALREREQQQSGGGGAGDKGDQDEEEQPGDQGSGGEAQGSPSESPAGGQAEGQSPMSREQAERILSAVEQDERELFQDKLKKGPQTARPTRDW